MKTILIFIVLIFLMGKITSSQTIRFVTQSGAGIKNGTSWANAYDNTQLQTAINGSGVMQVWVATGIYKPTTGADRTISFQMRNGVAVYGGFFGNETILSQRDWVANVTVLSGDLSGNDVISGSGATLSIAGNSENSYHVFYHPAGLNLDNSSVLDGFIIKGGNANGIFPHYYGGGMCNYSNSSPTVSNCKFTGNSTELGYGGAIYNYNFSSPTLGNCIISENYGQTGGGIYIYNSSPTILGCTISGNASFYGGGGVYCGSLSSPSFFSCVISGNSSSENSGGGVFIESSNPILTNCQIFNNSAVSGGGVFNSSSAPTLTNCLISGNSASSDGGGVYNEYSLPILTNSTLTGNSASNSGGGVYNSFSSPTFNNSIIWGNSAVIGGYQFYCIEDGTTYLHNCCYSIQPYDIFNDYAINASNSVNQSPQFADPVNNDFRISGNSPCADAGSDIYNSEENDIRGAGFGRKLLKTDYTQAGIIDIGAYEYNSGTDPVLAPVTVLFVKSDATGSNSGFSWEDAFTSLQDAIAASSIGDYEIWVAAGTYNPSVDEEGNAFPVDERTKCFKMKNDVAFYGGFSGTETSSTERDWRSNVTILSGDIGAIGDNSDNVYHVFYNSYLDNSAVLDGFTIQNGNADDYYGENSGAGIYSHNASPTISNCSIKENYAVFDGAGMYNYFYSSPKMSNCLISQNTAENNGGGFFNMYSSSPSLINCIITENDANYGAGIYSDGSSPVLTNCLITDNSAMDPGGGVANVNASSAILTNCSVSGNTSLAYGAGIFNSSLNTYLILNNSILWGNNSIGSGSEIFNDNSGTVTLNYTCYEDDISGTISINDGCFTEDPKFVNTSNGDFRINGNSPCADAGNDSYNYETTDIRGTGFGRKLLKTDASITGPIDLGAYEFNKDIDPYVYQIIYVDASKTSGLFDGTSWENAFTSLQTALTGAAGFSEIWVAAGTYTPTSGNDRNVSFHLKNDIAIYGGFNGTETMLGERNLATNLTILSGEIGDPGIADNSFHVIYNTFLNNGGNTALLDGFTIHGGNAFGSLGYGGGVYNELSSPTLVNCSITGNTAPIGGGLYNWDHSSPELVNCIISGNSATGDWGGGMYNYSNSSPTLINCTLAGNSSNNYGGGIVNNYESSPNIYNSIIWGNTATTSGNQIYNIVSSTSLYHTCYSNAAGDIFINGGAVTPVMNCINTDPLFVNVSINDYRIYGNSPCVNAGSNVFVQDPFPTTTLDIRGQLRIQNTTTDMGAFEWTDGIDPPGSGSTDHTLTLTVFPEGLYNGTDLNKARNSTGNQFPDDVADKVTIELHDAANYMNIIYSQPNLDLLTSGLVSVIIPGIYSGSYYLTVKHRNSIETVSAVPVSFSGSTVSYNFTLSAGAAFGNNLKLINGRYTIFGGDTDQDGFVNADDVLVVANNAAGFAHGYLVSDINGDGITDAADIIILDNNSAGFVKREKP